MIADTITADHTCAAFRRPVDEQDLARMINDGTISRDEGLAHADSPTNLLWRLANEQTQISRVAPKRDEAEAATFTEISIDVRPEEARASAPAPWAVHK
jgi:twitching motility protein PilU